MRKVYSGKYYSAFSRIRVGSGRSQILIMRRDTKEIASVTTVSSDRVKEVATELSVGLGRPSDWMSPHRSCLFYYMKIERKREEFGLKLISGKLNSHEIMSGVSRFEAYQRYLLKKLNNLSKKERLLLLSPSSKDLPPTTIEGIDLLQAREGLFWMFFEKSEEILAAHSSLRDTLKKMLS